jgi:hypothetical protein
VVPEPETGSQVPENLLVPGRAQEGPRDYFDRIEDGAFLETLKRLEKLEQGRGNSHL